MSAVGTGVALVAERGDDAVWLTVSGEAAVRDFAEALHPLDWPEGLRDAVDDGAGNLTTFEVAVAYPEDALTYARALGRMESRYGLCARSAASSLNAGPTGTRRECDECHGSGWVTGGGWS